MDASLVEIKMTKITTILQLSLFFVGTLSQRETTSTTMHHSIFCQEETWLPTVHRRYFYLRFVCYLC